MIKIWSLQFIMCLSLCLSAYVFADMPMPENPRWKPVVDEVYLQEISVRIPTKSPLYAVAVYNDVAYVGHGKGVSQFNDSALVPEDGPVTKVHRLRVLGNALWAISEKGLWRFTQKTWEKVVEGSFVDLTQHLDSIVVASTKNLHRLDGNQLVQLDEKGTRWSILGLVSYSETLYVRHATNLGFFIRQSIRILRCPRLGKTST